MLEAPMAGTVGSWPVLVEKTEDDVAVTVEMDLVSGNDGGAVRCRWDLLGSVDGLEGNVEDGRRTSSSELILLMVVATGAARRRR